VKTLKHVEACIEWAMQHGYHFAPEAAAEYGKVYGRKLVDDDNTGMYNTHTWVDGREGVP
jgi:hypothetical protein